MDIYIYVYVCMYMCCLCRIAIVCWVVFSMFFSLFPFFSLMATTRPVVRPKGSPKFRAQRLNDPRA